jgi:subtilisin family serine protease
MKNKKRTNNRFLAIYTFLSVLLFMGCDTDMINHGPTDKENVITESFSGLSSSESSSEITRTGRYLILTKNQKMSRRLTQDIEAAGGEIVKLMPKIGVAIAISDSPDFIENTKGLKGIESITEDLILQFTDPNMGMVENEVTAESESIGEDAFFDGFQWAPDAIGAPQAWDAGFTGSGVRVAILDGGIYDSHLDLAPNLDVATSASFVPGFNFNQDTGIFWHGTHVAGIVAASGNIGVVGIAPRATLVGVKVLHSGSGAFEWILEGIIYAATPQFQGGAGADIINMSLGATFNYRDNWFDKGFRDAFRELQKAYDRATRYAYQQGVTVIASAGNGATNYDDAKELFKIPAENQHVLSISSTGPTGWGFGATNFSDIAYYSDYGKSLVSLAAPGGSVGLAIIDGNFDPCTITGTFTSITATCAVFDQVFSTVRGTTIASYNWAQGTSMAAPAAAGVAALIIDANNREMSPAQVKTALQQSADDLGKPGNDEFYGHGWVNAARAVGL